MAPNPFQTLRYIKKKCSNCSHIQIVSIDPTLIWGEFPVMDTKVTSHAQKRKYFSHMTVPCHHTSNVLPVLKSKKPRDICILSLHQHRFRTAVGSKTLLGACGLRDHSCTLPTPQSVSPMPLEKLGTTAHSLFSRLDNQHVSDGKHGGWCLLTLFSLQIHHPHCVSPCLWSRATPNPVCLHRLTIF